MLQDSMGVKVTGDEFHPTYDHVLRELGDDAQRLLASIESAVNALPLQSSSGTKSFPFLI